MPIRAAPVPTVTAALLDWYDRNRRAMPWRALPGEAADPYRVWLSEVMLQQTTVAAVKPYFLRFLGLWPTVEALAAAPRESVMREWAGLGYYARARNLHECAKAVAERFGGVFPSDEEALLGLPGIGAYTGAAIAAIAFGRPAAVVDGNVERVMSRLFAIEAPLPDSRPVIRRLVADLVPAARPGDFAQATMDLGATVCTPKSPACGICPVRPSCRASATGRAGDLPRRAAKKEKPRKHGSLAVVIRPDGAVLVRTRPDAGLLGGMTEFFGTGWTEGPADEAALRTIADLSLEPKGTVDHVFTHFALRLAVYAGRSSGTVTPPGWRWVDGEALDQEPLATLMRKALTLARAPSALVALDRDGLGLVSLEGPDEQDGRKGADRETEAAEGRRHGPDLAEPDGGRDGADDSQR